MNKNFTNKKYKTNHDNLPNSSRLVLFFFVFCLDLHRGADGLDLQIFGRKVLHIQGHRPPLRISVDFGFEILRVQGGDLWAEPGT